LHYFIINIQSIKQFVAGQNGAISTLTNIRMGNPQMIVGTELVKTAYMQLSFPHPFLIPGLGTMETLSGTCNILKSG
jgi:hypothetical protein